MAQRATIIIDIGKTIAKASLWDVDGVQIDRQSRANATIADVLDAGGIAQWLAGALTDFARQADIGAIIPVAHGAAAAIIDETGLVAPPIDYEAFIPAVSRAAYDALRAPFAETGSPALPDGLNLGAQLYHFGRDHLSGGSGTRQILPWPQYWSWLLSGIASSEVTSLGCHTDLWNPVEHRPSRLAEAMGWAAQFAPLRRAGDRLGPITPQWAARTGLPADTQIYCGVHDSNAALVAARAFPEIAGNEATILSTGTWFVAMRSTTQPISLAALPEGRDCLVNVDVAGRPVPSARFMGGREIEVLTLSERIDRAEDQEAMIAAMPGASMILPSFISGSGPFPEAKGLWFDKPDALAEQLAAVALYAALMADTALDLIGATQTLLIEGRFGQATAFVRALATLRPDMAVYTSIAEADVSFGALRLINPSIKPTTGLQRVAPLPVNLAAHKDRWHKHRQEGIAT